MLQVVNFHSILAFSAALVSMVLAIGALWRRGSLAHVAFGVGMTALASDRLLSVLAGRSLLLSEVAYWEWWRFIALSFAYASWSLFSVCFARENYRDFVSRWKWALLISFAVPLSIAIIFKDKLFEEAMRTPIPGDYVLRLDQAGFAGYLVFFLSAVFILVNLERTLRSLFGAARWRVKFTIVGIGAFFVLQLYFFSQTLLFSIVRADLGLAISMALLFADALIVISVVRDRLYNTAICVSHEVLYNSITLVVVGAYLLFIGGLAQLAVYLGAEEIISDKVLMVFFVLLGFLAILLSDRRRREIHSFVRRHFRKPEYDYRNIWTAFTQRTASLVSLSELCTEVSRTISETFQVKNVSIWLQGANSAYPALHGSTTLTRAQVRETVFERDAAVLMDRMRYRREPVDLGRPDGTGLEISSLVSPEFLKLTKMRHCVPLAAGGEFLGLMILDGKMSEEPFSVEDHDLLKTIADQAASKILSHRLFDNLAREKEMKSFQAVSTFFVHDLKNVAATLSLTLKNLPVHFDNPEFRKDALKILAASTEKITSICSKLSVLNQKLQLNLAETDINEIVKSVVAGINGSAEIAVIQDLGRVPSAEMDAEQFQKVLLNLVLNATEAAGERCEIRVSTGVEEDHLVISVCDNGCGMTREFMEESLFQPYTTTKKNGLGIGLFQSKMIVEAHKGRIEVRSELGKGSTFRVILPVSTNPISNQ